MNNNKAIKSQFKFPTPFGFYLRLLKAMLVGKSLPYRFIYSCGGKASGKTYCFCLFVSYLFYYNISAIVLIFRKETKTVPQTLQEVLDRLQAAKIKHIHNKSRNTITSPSGKTRVAFYSLFNPRGEKVQQLGLTGNSNYIYEVAWFEEVWEMEEQSVRDAELAIRGAKYTLTVFTTNPYALAHWFVSFYVKKLPPNRSILMREGYQWKYFEEQKELVHMTNYRVNPALPPASIAKIEYFKDRDPSFYDIVGIGLPGVPKGGVYAHLLRFISRLTQEGNIYTAGLDWGFKHDPPNYHPY